MTAPDQPKAPPTQRVSDAETIGVTSTTIDRDRVTCALCLGRVLNDAGLVHHHPDNVRSEALDTLVGVAALQMRKKAAGTREDGLREAAELITSLPDGVLIQDGSKWRPLNREDCVGAIRARLTAPAEPTVDTGEKG